ncbi:MAG: NmrA family protein [Paenibacillus sp.]|jgi:NAD(P)H dehydrogenase (quinone)|nr:NmrA family protein [Paenibacillus sp.]
MPIAITGATGKLGSLVIHRLLQQVPSEQIIACVRQPEKAARYAELGIEVRVCDYDDPDTIGKALQGASKLLLISGSNPEDTIRMRQHAHVIEEAKKAKVEHLLYTSFAFAESGKNLMTHMHLATEHAIKASGIPYTLLRNALYSDFVGALGLDAAIAQGELVVPPGDWVFNTVTRDDLADGIAEVLTGPDHQSKTYEFTASITWNFTQLTEVLSEKAGKKVSLRYDPEKRNWLYGFLRTIDTSSTSADLATLIGRPAASLKESILPYLNCDAL